MAKVTKPKKFYYGDLRAMFWDKVDKNGPTMPCMTTPCWVWIGNTDPTGYGIFTYQIYTDHEKRKTVTKKAHRFSWYLVHKQELPGTVVLRHDCDNKICVNPSHLTPGTHMENTQDKLSKGRGNWSAAKKTNPRSGNRD